MTSDGHPATILAHRTPIYYTNDFRKKGYPERSFLSPRVPVSQLLENARTSDYDPLNAGKTALPD